MQRSRQDSGTLAASSFRELYENFNDDSIRNLNARSELEFFLKETQRTVLFRSKSLLAWRRAWGNPTALSLRYENFCRHLMKAPSLKVWPRSLLRCSGSIQCSIRCGMIRASKNSSPRPRRKRQTNKAAENPARPLIPARPA